MDLSKIEHDAIVMLLDNAGARYPELKEQFAQATISRREVTGMGFFLYFDVPSSVPKVMGTHRQFVLDLVHSDIEGVPGGVGFVLRVSKGLLDYLEGFTFDGIAWPSQIADYNLKYKKRSGEEVGSEMPDRMH